MEAPTQKQIWKNGTLVNTQNTGQGYANFPIYIGAINTSGTAQAFSNREVCFASLGTNIGVWGNSFSNAVNTLQTSLGRNTY